MTDNLPPLPDWAMQQMGKIFWEERQMRAYGQQCRAQALEEAALRFERVGGMIDPRSIAAAIRALKNETCHKGGRNEG